MPTLWSIDVRMAKFLYELVAYYHDKYEIEIVHTIRQPIPQARNLMLFKSLDYDYLLFLDDDNIPEDINFLDKLVEADKDIISWIIPKRTPDKDWIFSLCIYDEEYLGIWEYIYTNYVNLPAWDDIFEIYNCWMWCVLIKRDIIQSMFNQYDNPCEAKTVWFYIDWQEHIRDDEIDPYKITENMLRYKR